MEDPRWLRLITIGLVLAAIAVGYFLFTGRLATNTTKVKNQISQASPSASPTLMVTPKPTVLGQNTFSPAPTATASAYSRVATRTQAQTQTLPSTGFPGALVAVLSASTMIMGWGLRRFPK